MLTKPVIILIKTAMAFRKDILKISAVNIFFMLINLCIYSIKLKFSFENNTVFMDFFCIWKVPGRIEPHYSPVTGYTHPHPSVRNKSKQAVLQRPAGVLNQDNYYPAFIFRSCNDITDSGVSLLISATSA